MSMVLVAEKEDEAEGGGDGPHEYDDGEGFGEEVDVAACHLLRVVSVFVGSSKFSGSAVCHPGRATERFAVAGETLSSMWVYTDSSAASRVPQSRLPSSRRMHICMQTGGFYSHKSSQRSCFILAAVILEGW